LKNSIAKDMFEVGIAQNILEFIFPYDWQTDIQYALDEIRSYNQTT
jgi:hypothetical protein